ncbi:MAG: DUF4421 family protein [Cytophagales bacterium]|nr:DUF4421 family protein [Cytophaga sp.]
MTKYIPIVLLFILFLSGIKSYAQNSSKEEEETSDSVYIKRESYVFSARSKLTIFIFSSRYLNGMLFTNPGVNNYYFPIAPINIGLGFSHKWLAVSVSLYSPKTGRNHYDGVSEKYKNFNLQILAYTHKYGMDLLYTYNRGYYLGDYKGYIDVDGAPDKTPYFNAYTQRFTFNVLRIFNPLKYSMNAPIIGGEVQKNSSSSFIMNSAFSINTVNLGDSIPEFIKTQLNPDAIFTSGTFYSIGILPGYGFTWIVRKKFYFGAIPALGPSFQYKEMNFESGSEDRFAVSYRVLAKFGAGFHAKRWTAGLTLILDSERYHLAKQSDMISNNGKLILRVGYKINVPKWGKKVSKKMTIMQEKAEHLINNF